MGFRFIFLNIIFFSLFSGLVFNLYNLQVEDANYYFEKVKVRADYQEQLELRRGEIFFNDKNNNNIAVAINRDSPVVFASPKDIENSKEAARKLSESLDLEISNLEESFNNKDRLFKLLVDKATEEQIEKIKELGLEGIHISYKQYRYYPYSSLASTLLGFVGVNENIDKASGLYGLELFYEEELSSGDDVYLTIDRNIQSEVEKIINNLMEDFDAVGASAIVQNPETGEILAMASVPGFDPNEYSEYPIGNFINPNVQYVYEPGSVFKPLTMSMGIDKGVITPETTYFDTGSITLNGRTIRNWNLKANGLITMTNVIEKSVNTGAAFAGEKVGKESFIEYLEKYGFSAPTGIDVKNEVSGSINNLKSNNFREVDLATASFGQGTSVTPIQMVSSYSVIANGGLLMKPILNNNKSPEIIRRVIKEETAKQVIEMMESAVEKARVAAIDGYSVAGKTGTAQVPDFQNGGYSDQYIHNFVGFAPASDPQFTILIKLDKPNVDLAGITVVPAFKDLAQFILNYYNINPDKLTQ
ncbi:MAG: penicillin-binding protein 2 [Candidatus Paceibacterota bacterium]